MAYKYRGITASAQKFRLAAVALLLTGCASVPQSWTRTDGSIANAQQLAVDQTACRGEMQKSRMASTGQLGLRSQYNATVDIYVGCMAEKGYVGTN